jgi:hypothetical protein
MDIMGKRYPKEFGVSQAETLARIIRESEPNSEAVTDANTSVDV